MIDYKLKTKVIGSELLKFYNKWSKANYDFTYNENSEISLQELYKINEHASFLHKQNPTLWKECQRVSHSQYKRAKLLRDRITLMLEHGNCIFLTLTFDSCLERTTERSRKEYVKSFFSNFDTLYIANQDFGKQYSREHYHAIILANKINYRLWTHGTIKGLKVRTTDDDKKRLSKYISKLTNHAIKKTNKRQVIIYSRKFKFYE